MKRVAIACVALVSCSVNAPKSNEPLELSEDTTFPQSVVQVPGQCANDQVAQWDGTAWVCADSLGVVESDPTFSASPAFAVTPADMTNWDAAYGWGDHATANYLTSEQDPTVNPLASADLSSCTAGQIAKLNTAGTLWVCAADNGGTGGSVWQGTTDIYYSGGNVGIGTTSPAAMLEVVSTNTRDTLNVTATGASGRPQLRFTYNQDGGTTAPTDNTVLGLIDFGGHDGTALTSEDARIRGLANGAWSNTRHPTQFTFQTTPVGSVGSLVRMTIDNAGNVGIGTASPSHELTLAGNQPDFMMQHDGALSTAAGALGAFGAINARDNKSADPQAVIVLGREGLSSDASDLPTAIAFYTTADGGTALSERMRINNEGNVGIATTNPTQGRLAVIGAEIPTGNVSGIYGQASHGSGSGTANVKGIEGKAYSNSWTGTVNLYGVYGEGKYNYSGGGISNIVNLYGVAGIAEGHTVGTQTAIGGYFTASGADNNYAAIFADGNVGIGTTSPSTLLHVATATTGATITVQDLGGGSCSYGPIYAGGNICSSDARMKTGMRPLSNAVDKLMMVQGVSFRWKHDDSRSHLGVLAQDVEQVFPELVEIDVNGNMAVSYAGLVVPLIEAVKEQQSEIRAQRTEIDALTVLSEENKELKDRVDKLEQAVETLLAAKGTAGSVETTGLR